MICDAIFFVFFLGHVLWGWAEEVATQKWPLKLKLLWTCKWNDNDGKNELPTLYVENIHLLNKYNIIHDLSLSHTLFLSLSLTAGLTASPLLSPAFHRFFLALRRLAAFWSIVRTTDCYIGHWCARIYWFLEKLLFIEVGKLSFFLTSI